MRSKYLVIFVIGLSFLSQIDAQENEAIENIIVSASKNEQKLRKTGVPVQIKNLFEIFPSASERIRTLPNASGCIRMGPNASEQVQGSPKTSNNL